MSGAKPRRGVVPARTPTEVADELYERYKHGDGFTREQTRRAMARLFKLCSTAEVSNFHLSSYGQSMTILWMTCAREEAAALVGGERLPLPPRRISYSEVPWLSQARRVRNGRIFLYVCLTDDSDVEGRPLGRFKPSSILKLAPEGPHTVAEWKDRLRDHLTEAALMQEHLINGVLREPLFPRVRSAEQSCQEAFTQANRRFQLRDSDLQHLTAIGARHLGAMMKDLLAALEKIDVEDHDGPAALRLVVDNTP
jgi:hypothetical protein